MRTKRSSSEITWLEAQAVLDAALGELPEKYRAAGPRVERKRWADFRLRKGAKYAMAEEVDRARKMVAGSEEMRTSKSSA